MNFRKSVIAVFTFAAICVGLFLSMPPVSASVSCQKIRGNESVVNNGDGTTAGTITQGGQLNGKTESFFTSSFTPTPASTTFSFTDSLTITTARGVLQTQNVTLFDVASGAFSAIAVIEPKSGTEAFAGATGVLYINGKTADGGSTFQGDINGEICFAN